MSVTTGRPTDDFIQPRPILVQEPSLIPMGNLPTFLQLIKACLQCGTEGAFCSWTARVVPNPVGNIVEGSREGVGEVPPKEQENVSTSWRER